jgi:protein O-mannosyl-transferase
MIRKTRGPSQTRSTTTDILVSLLLFAGTLAVFGRTTTFDFVNFDDEGYVFANEHVQQGLTGDSLRWALTSTEMANWHPLTWISYAADYQLYGLEPAGYHLTNIVFHAANTVLLFWALRLMTCASLRSAWVAAFFAVHPLHVESVAWVAERKDVLSTFFWMLALLGYYAHARRPGWQRLLPVAAAQALGLCAKPMLVTLPCVLLLLDMWPLGRWNIGRVDEPAGSDFAAAGCQRLILEKAPLFALSAVSCGITFLAQDRSEAVKSIGDFPLAWRLANVPITYVGYVGKTFWPTDLAVFYPHARGTLPWWQPAGAAILLSAVTFWTIATVRRQPYLFLGWFWYLGTLVPVIGLVQVGSQAMADRYTYVPLIGIFIALVWLLGQCYSGRNWSHTRLALLAAAGLAACTAITWTQLGYWHDSITLWERAAAVTKDNELAHFNLGGLLERRGELSLAVQHFARAIEIEPRDLEAYSNLASVYQEAGDLKSAQRVLTTLVELDPGKAEWHLQLGLIAKKQGDFPTARREYEECLRLQPDNARAHNNLATVFELEGDRERALGHLRAAAQFDPSDATFQHNLGMALLRRHDPKAALGCLQRAVGLGPQNSTYRRSLAYALALAGDNRAAELEYDAALQLEPGWPAAVNRAAWRLATDPLSSRRRGDFALELALQACQATRNERPDFLDTLAAAYAEQGEFEQAVKAARLALEIAGARAPELSAGIERRLRLYQHGQPFRSRDSDE